MAYDTKTLKKKRPQGRSVRNYQFVVANNYLEKP